MAMSKEYRLVVALDIGTSQSGYAYSLANESNVVYTSDFHGSTKTTTCVLLDKNDKFVAYGKEAEDKYLDLCAKGDNSCKLFRNFKTNLHHNATLSKTTPVLDISGKHSVPLFDLLVMCIRYLKNHMIRWVNRLIVTYNEDDAFLVVLVPAIFDDRSKWLVREAAIKGGVKVEQFTLALEAETSSLWCQHENIDGIRQKGTRYIVCDIGGGIVDIVTHESNGDGSVDSVHYPCGGDWAGIQVENCLKSYLNLLFGTQSMESFIENQPAEWLKILKHFEQSKRNKGKESSKELTISVPEIVRKSAVSDKCLKNLSELADIIKPPNFGGHFRLDGEKLVVGENAAKGLYTYTVNTIVGALDKLYHKGVVIGEIIDKVLLVGGMVNDAVFQEVLKDSLDRYDVTLVEDSDIYAVKGGVLYGNQRSLIRSRVMALTYGIRTTVPYNKNKHSDGDKITLNGCTMCVDNFHVLVKAGSVINCGQEVKEEDKPLRSDDKEQLIEIYSCGYSDEIPSTVKHYSVQKESSLSIPLPFGCLVEDKIFERCVILGEPELSFRVTFKKGKKDQYIKSLQY